MGSLHFDEGNAFPLTLRHYSSAVSRATNPQTSIPGILSSTIYTKLDAITLDELERRDSEGPQHEVTVPPFFMGRFPITQAQWRAEAQLEPIDRELDPDPAQCKGDNRPVERVSWYDATEEFCARLTRFTGRDYRLPSEAEWEYACRAGTTTPFHFGETITTDLANYDGTDDSDGRWKSNYGQGPKGIDRNETTEVGSFPPNTFGLYDMHGNVSEWCQDYWHDNYDDAPTDGSAWIEGGDSERRILRGGAWFSFPRICRSAYRYSGTPDFRYDGIGFRVCCAAPRAVQ